jgi:RNA polymerase sigma-70 factor (ECF subfamily)
MSDTADDRDWVARSQAGDCEAFEELIKRHQHMIHGLTYRMTGSMSDAEDLAQEALIRAYHGIKNFRGDSSFSSWLYRVAMNECLRWKKSAERRQHLHQEWAAQDDPPSGQADSQTDTLNRLQEALLKLKPKHRAAIVLTTCEGMNHAEAGKVLGCSETTISWRVHTARKELKRLMTMKEAAL